MVNKRSKGVTILAILILLGGIINLSIDLYAHFNDAPVWRILICALLHIAQIVCAIGILGLKEIARKITIFVYAAYIIWAPLVLVLFDSKKTIETLPPEIPLETAKVVLNATLASVIIFSILWFSFVIYFFTRSKVKEQFK